MSSERTVRPHLNVSTLDIYLRQSNGNGCLVTLNSSCTLTLVHRMAQQSLPMLKAPLRLFHKGKQLIQDHETIFDIGLTNYSIIHVEPNSVTPKNIRFDVGIYCEGEKVTIGMSQNETVRDLKKKVHRISGILPSYQRLVFHGQKLKESWNMEECHITNDSLICLTLKAPQLAERSSTFEVNENHKELIDKAASVKERVLTPTISDPQLKTMHQSIIKKGQFEAYELQIRDYGIQNPTSEEESLGGLSKQFDYQPLAQHFNFDQVAEEKEFDDDLKQGLRETHPYESEYESSEEEERDEVLSFSKRLMII